MSDTPQLSPTQHGFDLGYNAGYQAALRERYAVVDANDVAERLRKMTAAGEITTPTARDLAHLALDVCELELSLAALRGRCDAAERDSAQLRRQLAALNPSAHRPLGPLAPVGAP